MDLVVPLILVVVTFIYEPGNVEINNYCRGAVEDEIFDSKIECWNHYNEYRDEIPNV